MSSDNVLNTVRKFLTSHFMFVDDDWITGCVEYLCVEARTETDIKNLAREQWLLNDLKDICPGSLPANLKIQPKTVLNGRYVLQINAAFDIGTPAYQQYLKLQKVNMENVEATVNYEDKISSHRMIKLFLTDGVQEITAVEYRPMRNLSCDITPGCKVLIKGPVDCRRGMLLLTEPSIELLGGEVGEIAGSNSLAGLLSSKLGLPMTVTQASDLNSTISQLRNSDLPAPHTHMPPPPEPMQDHRPVARVTSLQVASSFNNEDDDYIDVEQLAYIEAQIEMPTKRPQGNTLTNPEKKIKMDLTDVNQLNTRNSRANVQTSLTKIDLTVSNPTNTTELTPAIDLTSNVNTADDYPDENDVFFDDDEDYLRELEAQFEKQIQPSTSKHKAALSTEPYVYIKEINDLPPSKRLGRVFKVKGQIMKLLSKLSVGKEGWSLRCTIVDGTGTIDVEFTSEVLSKLVGFTPQEMNQLKKQMASKPELKEKAVCALQKAKDNLQVLFCIIELTILEVPKITKLIPFDASHAESHRKRIESSGFYHS